MARVLEKQAVLLLIVQALYGVANALSGTFLPVYLWKASQSYLVIGWFTLAQYVVGGVTFWLAGKWVKEYNKMNSLRAGIALSGLFYCAVLLLGGAARSWIVPLGILSGMAGGLFWLAYNVVYFEITEPDTRDRFNGWAGLLGAAAGIVAPWTSGVVITSMQGVSGYRIIFTISLAIFAISVVLSFFLKKRQGDGAYNWKHGWMQLKEKGNPWRRMLPAIAAQGVREGVFMFLVGLTVYTATKDESKLGMYSLITSFVALLSFWLVGRWLKKGGRKWAMLVGVIMLGVVILPLFVGVTYTTLLIFGVGTSLFMPLYIIPMTSRVFDLIGQSQQSATEREEFVVLREGGLTFGRLIGLAAYMLVIPFNHSEAAITWLMLAVGISPVLGWWLISPFLTSEKI